MAPTPDTASLPPTNYAPGFKRARAGTLPSNVQLAAQRLAASSSSSLAPTPPAEPAGQLQVQPSSALSIGVPSQSRPALRHSSTVAPSVPSHAAPERISRLRSGSLTLPTGGLSNAFGPSIFSSSWLSSTNGPGNFSVLDELRSVTSADSGADDFDVPTLDYLGLDDSNRPPPAATISELRNQAQAAIAGNLANPPRLRASTVSNPYRSRPSAPGSLLSTPAAEEEEEYFEYEEQTYSRQRINSYETSAPDGGYAAYAIAKGFKPADHLAAANGMTSRPRAISVGILDDPLRSLQRRTLADAQQSYIELASTNSPLSIVSANAGSSAGILKMDKPGTRSNPSVNVHFPNGDVTGNRSPSYLVAPGLQNRAISPKSDAPSSQVQTPTRSLWIGNLDSAVTSEQLIHVFAPYGAIESLRLLPEKVCCLEIAGGEACRSSLVFTGVRLCQLCRPS